MEKKSTKSKSINKGAILRTLYPLAVMVAIFGLVFLALFLAL